MRSPLPFPRRWASLILFLLGLAGSGSPVYAVGLFSITLKPGPGLLGNPEALAAFERAAGEWEAWIADPITIYVDAELTDLGSSNIIGSTSYYSYTSDGSDLNLNYDLVRNRLAARASEPGREILGALPTSAQVTATVPDGTTFVSSTIGILRANQRALGFLAGDDPNSDGIIRFNSNFSFDYDNSDGVDFLKYDFQTVAAHEIGHLLGFLSDVDELDGAALPFENLTTLDLFRFKSGAAPTTAMEFTSFPRVLTPGVASVFGDTVSNYEMSTGSNQGDLQQASHWKNDDYTGVFIGLMDPTLNYGTIETPTVADLRALELIGYNVVPEPSQVSLLVVGLGWVVGLRRRRV